MTDLVHWIGAVLGGGSGLWLMGRGLVGYAVRHKEHQTELAKRDTVKAQNDASNDSALWAELREMRRDNNELRGMVGRLEGQNLEQRAQMEARDRRIDELVRQNAGLEAELAAERRERAAEAKRSEALHSEMGTLRRAIASGGARSIAPEPPPPAAEDES